MPNCTGRRAAARPCEARGSNPNEAEGSVAIVGLSVRIGAFAVKCMSTLQSDDSEEEQSTNLKALFHGPHETESSSASRC